MVVGARRLLIANVTTAQVGEKHRATATFRRWTARRTRPDKNRAISAACQALRDKGAGFNAIRIDKSWLQTYDY